MQVYLTHIMQYLTEIAAESSKLKTIFFKGKLTHIF